MRPQMYSSPFHRKPRSPVLRKPSGEVPEAGNPSARGAGPYPNVDDERHRQTSPRWHGDGVRHVQRLTRARSTRLFLHMHATAPKPHTPNTRIRKTVYGGEVVLDCIVGSKYGNGTVGETLTFPVEPSDPPKSSAVFPGWAQ